MGKKKKNSQEWGTLVPKKETARVRTQGLTSEANSQGGDPSTPQKNNQGEDPRALQDPVERWRVQEERKEEKWKKKKKKKEKKVKCRRSSWWIKCKGMIASFLAAKRKEEEREMQKA